MLVEIMKINKEEVTVVTSLVYKSIFGKDAKQLREEYGISPKEELRDCFRAEELQQVQKAEMLVSGLIDYGFAYNGIKRFLSEKERAIFMADFQ